MFSLPYSPQTSIWESSCILDVHMPEFTFQGRQVRGMHSDSSNSMLFSLLYILNYLLTPIHRTAPYHTDSKFRLIRLRNGKCSAHKSRIQLKTGQIWAVMHQELNPEALPGVKLKPSPQVYPECCDFSKLQDLPTDSQMYARNCQGPVTTAFHRTARLSRRKGTFWGLIQPNPTSP